MNDYEVLLWHYVSEGVEGRETLHKVRAENADEARAVAIREAADLGISAPRVGSKTRRLG